MRILPVGQAMGAETFIQPGDIINANKKLLLAFCAQLFNTNPNLTVEVCAPLFVLFYGVAVLPFLPCHLAV